MREMKDSGVEWIGKIPKEWEVRKIKHVADLAGRIGWQGLTSNEYCDEGALLITGINFKNGKIDWNSCVHVPMARWHEAEQIQIKNEDLLITKDGTVGKVAIVENMPYETSLNSGVLLIRTYDCCNKKYLFWILQSQIFWKWFGIINSGNSTIVHLYQYDFCNFSFSFPPLTEQHRISVYLDAKCEKIDSIIARQLEIIEKLKAYKFSVITEAVTKGLNPDVKMKESGVQWIGEIPEECKVTRAGHIFSIILGKMLSPTPKQDDDTFENYLCAANVHFTGISYEPLKQMWFSEIEKQIYAVQYGDLLVVEGGAGAGGAAIVEEKLNNCYIQNSIMIVRSKEDVSNKWLYYTLYAIVKRNYVDFVCNKATIPHFTKDKLGNVPVVIFTEENETEIVNYLDKKCSAIDSAIEKKQALIEKLKEYKKSLIYEVVTGKREV